MKNSSSNQPAQESRPSVVDPTGLDSKHPLRAAFRRWLDKGGSAQAAALTFFSLFAIGPVLTVSLAIVADLLGGARARANFRAFLDSLMTPGAGNDLIVLLEGQQGATYNSFYTVNGALALFGAAAFMRQLRRSMSGPAMLDFPSRRKLVLFALVNRLIAFGLVALSVAGLAVLSVLTAVVSGLLSVVDSRLRFPGWVLPLSDAGVTLLIATLCLFTLYRFVPQRKPRSALAVASALLVALAFVVGKSVFALYLARAPVGTTYGTASSLVATMLWLFFVCNLMLLGNEFAQELQRRVKPEEFSG